MKEFEIICPLTREPRLKEIEAKAGGWKWVLKKRSIDARKEPVWRYQYEAYGPGEQYQPYELPVNQYEVLHEHTKPCILRCNQSSLRESSSLRPRQHDPYALVSQDNF